MYRGKNTAVYLHKATELINAQIAWVEKELLAEQNALNCPLCPEEKKLPLKWTGSIAEWVELIYALYLVKRINNGKISLKNLFRWMGEIFDFEVREHASYFMNIKNRMDENRTKFTDLMCDALLERMTESDRKPPLK
ncbi:MAG: RteC domain-containing protein [Tannerella sp.]|nr:RteC domain-containing protein [Tannerella sp.]